MQSSGCTVSSAEKAIHPKQVPELTGLRAIAALCILVGHSAEWLGSFSDSNVISLWFGETVIIFGMPLFYVLSGFVIHYNYAGLFARTQLTRASLEFFGHRFARLFPLYACALFVGFTAQYLVSWIGISPGRLAVVTAHDLTATQSWFYIIFYNQLLLYFGFGLGWSISTEFFFYLVYPLIFWAFLLLAGFKRALVAFLFFALATLVLFAAIGTRQVGVSAWAISHLFPGAIPDGEYSLMRWFFYYSPYVQIFQFVLGALAAQLFMQLSDRPVGRREERIAGIFATLALGLLVAFSLSHVTGLPNAAVHKIEKFLALNVGTAFPIAVIMLCAARYASTLSRVLRSVTLVTLGELSYSIYVVHTFICWIFLRPAPYPVSTFSVIDAVSRIAIAIVMTLLMSYATYNLIEVPGRRKLRRLFDRGLALWFPPIALKEPQFGWKRIAWSVVALASFAAVLAFYQFLVVPLYSGGG